MRRVPSLPYRRPPHLPFPLLIPDPATRAPAVSFDHLPPRPLRADVYTKADCPSLPPPVTSSWRNVNCETVVFVCLLLCLPKIIVFRSIKNILLWMPNRLWKIRLIWFRCKFLFNFVTTTNKLKCLFLRFHSAYLHGENCIDFSVYFSMIHRSLFQFYFRSTKNRPI